MNIIIPKIKIKLIATMVAVLVFAPSISFAADKPPRVLLKEIYNRRPDLQRVFDSRSWQAKRGGRVVSLGNLENWARQYGHNEYPIELGVYKPEPTQIDNDENFPKLKNSVQFPESQITAESFIVVDKQSGATLLSKKPDLVWPLASLTKLVTALMVLNNSSNREENVAIFESDDVGGGKLYVASGTEFVFNDVLASMLIGSANNAATALARVVGGTREQFVNRMNDVAREIGAKSLNFVDPSGIEVLNMGSVSDFVKIVRAAFENPLIEDLTTRSRWEARATSGELKNIKNTNWLLTDSRYDDIYVTAGKTGYIDEAKWNLAVSLKPMRGAQHELIVVALGSGGRRESFDDAAGLARWTWRNFEWE